MRLVTVLGLLFVACAPRVSTPPPEAAPMPAASKTEPLPPVKVVDPPPPPAPSVTVARDGHVVSAVRKEAPCPWVEYSTEWKGLRLRSDKEGCTTEPIAASSAVAQELMDAIAKELGAEYAPRSFGMSDYPEFYERVGRAAGTSATWNGAAGKPKKGSAEAYVADLVRDGQTFYPEVIALFAPQKLTPELSSVEKVLVSRASETRQAASLSQAGVKPDTLVPSGSIVWFRLTEP